MKLTEKQKRFADYYIETGNGAESARKAGYKGKNHDNIATENLRKLAVKNYIDEKMTKKNKEIIASQDEVLSFLTQVLRGEVTEQTPITMKDYWEMADKEPSLKDRTKAAELLGKRYAMWTDKQQIDGIMPVTIVNDLDD